LLETVDCRETIEENKEYKLMRIPPSSSFSDGFYAACFSLATPFFGD